VTATLWSSRFKTDLYGLHWKGLAGVSEQWLVLQRLLRAFADQEETLGRISGDLQVVSGRPEAYVFEQWTVTADAETIQAQLSRDRRSLNLRSCRFASSRFCGCPMTSSRWSTSI
jgi:hypothetical protein